ncbi:type I restriction-modification system subunit M [Ligilactobacillus equi]|uniref:site-specific DNA-methyltransferase (adenine-specific) n=1 Tax=Ligilactobacillus equi DPC 6820 TaxID=1392007 RepID=V7HWA4_9LACO|nr:type I restriction-modification system subunit M [Ligilactobacillus equi]ETA73555.1 type I restriction-modification system, M subunit [Ligilactobacillus equi DPC 6820]
MTKTQDIGNKLWSMANELRGKMDASDYRDYILGFMFYRYLSDHQETYLRENEVLDVEIGENINDAYRREASGEDLADYTQEISSSLGYAINPEDTWASIMAKIHDSKIKPSDFQDMFDHFEANAQLNNYAENDFKGIFSDINLSNSRLGASTNARTKALIETAKLVDDFDYHNDDGNDVLGDVYEYLIKQFASSSGKNAGEFYTPHEVSQVLAKLVSLGFETKDDSVSVYDPTMGSGSLLLTVGNEIPEGRRTTIRYYGQELNTTTYNLARMNLMMHGVSYDNMTLRNADTLEMDWPDGLSKDGVDHPRSFDAVVANPPYSLRWDNNESKLKDARFKDYGKLAPKTKADYAFLLHSLYHLQEDGTAAIVLPHGVLFRGAAEGVIRKALINKNQIDAVIGLPANLFYSTGIPTLIMVLKKRRDNNNILFIDASKDFQKDKNQNRLLPEHIEKIINTYKE